ncbi:MAG: hypothetical protein PHP46_03800 [Candidatus Omnitrophica bacterium]|nr:hypothetical protein [Candidatus Omnitrophota bacterium]
MILYWLYILGYVLAVRVPIKLSYFIACILADFWYLCVPNDRKAIIKNLRMVEGDSDPKRLTRMGREVFRNFAKYLVEFFNFCKADTDYINKFVKVEGLENIKKAFQQKKGIILLSAHIGNWEVGAFMVSSVVGMPISAVVLTHQNERINKFFTSQRRIGNMMPIEIGISLRSCYRVLKNNGLLALLGDRDFSKNGLKIPFFGCETLMPKGPAALSQKLGSPIVPTFFIRQPDDTFKLIMEEPIYPEMGARDDGAIERLARKYITVMESYITRYPTQWYVFREVWNNDEKSMRPDTII